MSLRDWLLIGGGILLLIVILDGVRRMRQRGRLRLDIDSKLGDLPEPDLSSELPNGGARPARGRAGAAEPSFSTPPKAAVTGRSGSRQPFSASRQAPQDDEIDLLLADDLQGVGQGADRWLSGQDPIQDLEPLHAGGARDEAWADWDERDAFDDDGEEAVSRPRRARVVPPVSPAAAVKPSPFAAKKDDPAEPFAALDRRHDNGDEGLSGDLQERFSEDVDQSPDKSADESPRLTLTERPSAGADGLDLSKPVPELVEQMASRSRPRTEPVSPADAKRETVLESRAEAISELKVELKNEPADEALGTAWSETALDPEPLTATRGSAGDSAEPTNPAAKTGAQAEPDESEAEEPALKLRGRKARKKKGRRGLPEIQINIFDAHPELAPEPELPARPAKAREAEKKELQKKALQEDRAPVETAPAADPAQDVLVISVAARREPFQGNRLFKLLAACDLTFGDMNIFHRHEEPGAKGPVQFSMANAVKPGTFDLSEPERFRTPAVTFFLNMAEPRELDNAFDCMLATAKCVAENLDGELKDENRSSLRPQTIEHCRQRIRDFKRRRMTRRS